MTSLNLSHQWLYFTSLHLIIYYYQPEHLVSKTLFYENSFNIFIFCMYYIKFSQYFYVLNYYIKLINKIIF